MILAVGAFIVLNDTFHKASLIADDARFSTGKAPSFMSRVLISDDLGEILLFFSSAEIRPKIRQFIEDEQRRQ